MRTLKGVQQSMTKALTHALPLYAVLPPKLVLCSVHWYAFRLDREAGGHGVTLRFWVPRPDSGLGACGGQWVEVGTPACITGSLKHAHASWTMSGPLSLSIYLLSVEYIHIEHAKFKT